MSGAYDGPQVGELAIVQGPLVRIAELGTRDGTAGAVVAVEGLRVSVPLAWLIRVPLDPG